MGTEFANAAAYNPLTTGRACHALSSPNLRRLCGSRCWWRRRMADGLLERPAAGCGFLAHHIWSSPPSRASACNGLLSPGSSPKRAMPGLARAWHTRRVRLVGTGPWKAIALASNQETAPRIFWWRFTSLASALGWLDIVLAGRRGPRTPRVTRKPGSAKWT